MQFSPSPNGKVREVSEAKKRALAGNNIFNDAQVSVVYVGSSLERFRCSPSKTTSSCRSI